MTQVRRDDIANKWRVTDELFAIPHRDRVILYAPFKGAIALVSKLAAGWIAQSHTDGIAESLPKKLHRLKQVGIIESTSNPRNDEELISAKARTFYPTGIIFLTTTFCNFRCVYCYASAEAQYRRVDIDVAKAAIRLAINNALNSGERVVEIAFHGGGEPTMALPFIKRCVEYARVLAGGHLEIAPSIVTNGYLGERQIEWLGQNMSSIQVSLDGPAEIQNSQRPLVSGKATYERVAHSVHRFIDMGVPNLLIKSTIAQPIVHRLPEIARFLCETFKIDRFHLGPVLNFGRAIDTGHKEPDVLDFLEFAVEAQEIATTFGKHIVISGAQETFPNLRREFCGLTEPNFAITTDGRISSCYQVFESTDPRTGIFHYGEFQNGDFHLDPEKVAQLRLRQHTLAPKCHRCFARWQCAGDCQVRWYDETSGEYDDRDDFRCAVNRELIKRELIRTLDQADDSIVSMSVREATAHSYVD